MQRILLKSKIHRAKVTAADLDYEGSVTLDRRLMQAADLRDFEQVQIYSVSTGARLTTYAISGPGGGGTVQINGAAAHLVRPGDIIIIASYAHYSEAEARAHQPRLVYVDSGNTPRRAFETTPATAAPLAGANTA
jgi:aspartate 1-decarboxylase